MGYRASDAREVVVGSVRDETADIRTYALAATDGAPLPAYSAGAHIDVLLPNGLSRSYSLIGPLDNHDRYLIAVARDRQSRGSSSYLHDVVRPGMRLAISQPRNHFPLVEDGAPSMLFAGGIGITPLWCMVQRLSVLGTQWRMLYACRSRDAAAFLPELTAAAAASAGSLSLWCDDEHGDQAPDLAAALATAPPQAHLYCCGPSAMLGAFRDSSAHWPPERVHTESFKAGEPDGSPPPLAPCIAVLARSGVELEVAEGSTILDACIMNGIDAPYSCYEGLCGTCETRVIEGIPDHRDALLTARARASNETIIICRSGSKTPRIVLDL